METELQEAERFAREFLDSPWALFRTRLLARVFLAQQARLAEVERERDAWKLKAESEGIRIKWRDEERADAERKATELERERDAAIEARDIHNEMLLAAYRNNAEAYAARNAAERKATEAAREQQKAWVAGVRWMCEKFAEAPEVVRAAFTPDKGDVVFYCGERIENIAATLYPAPTEREAAQECPCGRVRQLCGTVGCSNPAPTERKQYTEGIVLKPTEREATPPQAAPEPLYLVVEYQGPLGDWRGDAYRTRVRLTPEICRRIVAMAGVPVPEEGGR